MFLDDLPHPVLYNICKYLSFSDITQLLKVCKRLYILIEKNNYFWIILIRNHFGFKLYHRYVHEIFENTKNSDYVLYNTEQDRIYFEKSYQKLLELMCYLWLWNILDCKNDSHGYITYKRIVKQKKRPRTNHYNMSLTIEELFQYYLNRNKYLTNENICQIPWSKLIYFYLIECKRLSCLDFFPVYLRCSLGHTNCSNTIHSHYEYDSSSSMGLCVRLYSNINICQFGIKGKFKSILPGIYEILCRIKLDKNENYFSYFTECCSQNRNREKYVECYFIALADRGLDCEVDEKKLNYDWFESNYLLHGNQNWFIESMGKIKVFELSNIYFGFKITRDYRYRNILFDYIQLNIVE